MTTPTFTPNPLTVGIGVAERSLRALLDQKLQAAGLTFPQWTVLTMLGSAGALSSSELIDRQLEGHVVPDRNAAQSTLDTMLTAALIVPSTDDPTTLTLTPTGESTFLPLRQAVAQTSATILGNLPAPDVEATLRTLTKITTRATTHLTPTS